MDAKIKRITLIMYSSIALGTGVLFISLTAGNLNPIYYWGFLGVIPFYITALVQYLRLRG